MSCNHGKIHLKLGFDVDRIHSHVDNFSTICKNNVGFLRLHLLILFHEIWLGLEILRSESWKTYRLNVNMSSVELTTANGSCNAEWVCVIKINSKVLIQ